MNKALVTIRLFALAILVASGCGGSDAPREKAPPSAKDTVFSDLVATEDRAKKNTEQALEQGKQNIDDAIKKGEQAAQ